MDEETDMYLWAEDVVKSVVNNNRYAFEYLHRFGDGKGAVLMQTIQSVIQYNPPKRREKAKKRIPSRLRKRVFERDMYRCRRCSTHLGLTIDHIIPEVRGGPTEEDNLQTLCEKCNKQKGTKPNAVV